MHMGFPRQAANTVRKLRTLTVANVRCAKGRWGDALTSDQIRSLKILSREFQLSIACGELYLLSGRWYITHSGLLRLARRNRCSGIWVQPVREFCDPQAGRWAFKATAYRSRNCKGFAGYGDADPSNVSPLVRGAEMRIAETRAVNRALGKAYGIGICSVEELGAGAPAKPAPKPIGADPQLVSSNGHSSHPLRDQLNALIHKHQLDPLLIKRYAAEFCGTQALREASKALVKDFIAVLSKKASEDLSYQTAEAQS